MTSPTPPLEAEKVARSLTEAFNRGYLIAVANIIHTHGEDVIAGDVLGELGVSEGIIKQLDLCDFDAKPLRKLFRENARLARVRSQRRILESERP